jgi:hypothetical protein
MAVIGFTTNYPKKVDINEGRTNFVEKVVKSLLDYNVVPREEMIKMMEAHPEAYNVRAMETTSPKIHTLRKKNTKRKVGSLVHASVNVRSENQYQFAPEFKIKKLVDVKFTWSPETNGRKVLHLKIGKKEFRAADMISGMVVWVSPVLIEFAKNDGFGDTKKFLKWFDESQTLQLIQWVDYDYEIPED